MDWSDWRKTSRECLRYLALRLCNLYEFRSRSRRHSAGRVFRQGTEEHRRFVAGMQARAFQAVLMHLVGQRFFVHDLKAYLSEEIGDARKQTDTGYALALRLH